MPKRIEIGKKAKESLHPTLARFLTSQDMHQLVNIAARSRDVELRDFVDRVVRCSEVKCKK
jgi:hypothetical protein